MISHVEAHILNNCLIFLQVFHDLDPNFVVDDEMVYLDKVLGKGAFGKVYAGELRRVCKLEIKKS